MGNASEMKSPEQKAFEQQHEDRAGHTKLGQLLSRANLLMAEMRATGLLIEIEVIECEHSNGITHPVLASRVSRIIDPL